MEAFWISIFDVLFIVVGDFIYLLLQLFILLRLLVCFKLRCQFSKFLIFNFSELNGQFAQTNHCFDNVLIAVQLIIIVEHQALKRHESELAQRVQIVIILVANHILYVLQRVGVLFQSLSVVGILELVIAANLLKPDALVIVHC